MFLSMPTFVMVKRIVLLLDDTTFEKLKAVKEASGKTWEKFVLEKCLGGEDQS